MLAEIILGVAVIFLLWIFSRKPAGLPPGRWGLPLIGYIPLKNKFIDDHLFDFQKQYGDIYVWRLGTQVLLFIHDYNLVRQVFASQEFTERPDWKIFKASEETARGVVFSKGDIWHTNRRFSLRQLKNLGMGKSALSSAVHAQALKLVEALKEEAGKPGPITPALNVAIVNVIWQMIASKQFERDDPCLLEFQKLMVDLIGSMGPLIVPDIFPWLENIMPTFLLRKLFSIDLYDSFFDKFFSYYHELIEEHRASLDPDDPKDLIDAYLIEMEKGDDNNNLRSEKDLTFLIFDLFFAGTDTTTNTAKWMFLYMASYPEVQKKVQKEIDEVLPKGTLVSMDDKPRLQYTEAMINEVLRKSSQANTGLQHSASQDTQLAGYNIPKGTVVMSAVDSIHNDPRYWDKPDEFLPERFLDSEGKLVMKKEGFLPFGVGKRSCIGESLARMEFLIIGTTVLQNFNIAPPPGKVLDLSPEPSNPLGHDPRKEDVIFSIRE